MKIIIVVNAIKPSLTGIGCYTWELASRITRMPEIDAVRFLFESRWGNDICALLNQSPAKLAVRQRLLHNPFAVAAYHWLPPLLLSYRLISFSNHVYHNLIFICFPLLPAPWFFYPSLFYMKDSGCLIANRASLPEVASGAASLSRPKTCRR